MICYKDMTFCKESKCKKFGEGKCFRSLTPKVMKNAEKIGLGISMFAERPDCFEE